MKIGKMEGKPEEINDFFKNNGLNIEDYVEKPEPPLTRIWFIIPMLLMAGTISILTLYAQFTRGPQTFLFIIGCIAGFWLTVNVYLRFKSIWVACFIALTTVLVMLVAIGVIPPSELPKHIRALPK